jgi:hypothetical protein
MFDDENNDGRATYGTPLQPKAMPDSAGATVPPVLGGSSPESMPAPTSSQAPSFAAGGAIDDSDSSGENDGDSDDSLGSNAGVPDQSTDAVSNALKVVDQAMMYGRKKAGLPTDDGQQQDSAMPGGAATPSYAEGGAIDVEDDSGTNPQAAPDNGAVTVPPNDDSAPPEQPNYMNPPEGNPIQGGAQATEKFLGDTFGRQGPIPSTGQGEHAAPTDTGFTHALGSDAFSTGGIANKIMSWLRGDNAATPQEVQGIAAQVGNTGNPDANAALTVAKAAEVGGPEAADKVIAYGKQRYNVQMAHALAAAQGTPQRPADLRVAADSATKAYSFMPDGVGARFTASPNGITATVTPWGQQPSTYELSPQQFAQVVDVKKDGLFDAVYARGGIGSILDEVTKQGAGPQGAPAAGTAPQAQGGKPQSMADYVHNFQQQGAPQAAEKERPYYMDQSKPGLIQKRYYDELGTDEPTARRAVMSASGNTAKAAQGVTAQENEEENRKNKVDVASEVGRNRIEAARQTGAARVQTADVTGQHKEKGWQFAAQQKLEAAKAKIATQLQLAQNTNANAAQTRALKLVQTKIMSAQALTPQEQAFVDTLPGAAQNAQAPQAPQPRAPQAPQPQSPQDQQALAWAKANAGDPRASKIMQRLGVQ